MSISTEDIVSNFHDVPQYPNSTGSTTAYCISTPNHKRVPVFFFINNVHQQTPRPFCYFVRKCHFTICYNESSVSWLLQSLCDLYRICHRQPVDLQQMIVDICSNIEDLKIYKRVFNLRPEAYLFMSSYDRFVFRRLLLTHWTNTNTTTQQEHHSNIELNNISYDIRNSQEGRKRGHCLILNYNSITIADNIVRYEIGKNDVNLLMKTFNLLNFDVEVYDDLTVNATREILLEESSFDHSSMDCFVLFVIAECHNEVLNNLKEDVFVCHNRKTFSTPELLDYFSDKKCPSIVGKPKLIFFQQLNCVIDESNQVIGCYNLVSSPYLSQQHFSQLPSDHFLLFVCTFQAFSSLRKTNTAGLIDKCQNSVFILILCRVLSNNWTKYDLMSMLHMVTIELCYNTDHFYIDQCRNSFFKSSLTKLVHFGIDALKAQLQTVAKQVAVQFKYCKKCIIIDQQNCKQSQLDEIELAFTKMKFHAKQLKNLSKSEISTLVEKECSILTSADSHEQNCIVFCIFANCKAFSLQCKSNEMLRIRNIIDPASRGFESAIDCQNRVYFLINDQNQSNCTQDQCLTALTLNLHLTINTNPNLSFFGRLANALRNIIKPDELLDNLSKSIFNPYIRYSEFVISESEVDDYDVKTSWMLAKNILAVSTNFNSNCDVIDRPEAKNAFIYPMPNKDKGKCVILSFELSDFKQIEAIDKDVKNLERFFVGLSFDVDSFTNLTCKQTWDCLTRESQNFEWSSACFALCLVTRFENGYFACIDGKINFNAVLKLFENSLPMEDKPKILIIQDPYHSHLWKAGDADLFSYLQSEQYDLPKDCLIAHSSFNDRSITTKFYPSESWFVRMLEIVLPLSRSYDLLTLLRAITMSLVNPQFHHQYPKLYLHYPNVYVKSTLTRMILFVHIANEYRFIWNADTSVVNRTFREANQEVKLSTSRDALFYSRGRGKCLIVKNCSTASQADVVLLERTFMDINFDVQIEEVHERNSVKLLIKKESKRNHQEFSCLVLFILVNESHILSGDTSRDNLIEYFTGHWSLVGKPKLIFVLGGKQDFTASKEMQDSKDNERLKFQGSFRIPKYADFLFLHSELVSSTIQTLCSILSNDSNHDMLTLLIGPKLGQPTINSTLTRLVAFPTSESLNSLELLPDDQSYQLSSETHFLSHENRGKCLIFNYKTFINQNLRERMGSERDLDKLELVFGSVLKLTVEVFNDLSIQQTRQILEKESETDYSQLECFVICFLSHGQDNGVLHCNDGSIHQDELVKSLVINSSLDDKPKLMFVQACHGTSIDPGILVTDSPTGSSLGIPLYQQPDLFVFSSSYPGHYSYRDSNGSWFIQSLCDAFLEYHQQYDLTTIATIVCRTVGYRSDCEGQLKQIPFFHCTLTRPIAFA